MSSRIEIEFTSKREDGIWTWRAAGAKQPKGTISENLLYPGAKVGDVVKVDAIFEVDGITIQAVIPPKSRASSTNTIELLTPSQPTSLITSRLVEKKRSNRSPRRGDGQDARTGARDNKDRTDRPRSGTGPARGTQDRRTAGRPRREELTNSTAVPSRGDTRPSRETRPQQERPKAKRLIPTNKHRNSFLLTIPEEHKAIAEQLLRGGIPAVRAAIKEANEAANAEQRPATPEQAVLTIAESLAQQSQTAVWKDRAEGALRDVDEISLRDLRSVVSSADASMKDPEARELANQLRTKLTERVDKTIAEWLTEITKAIQENRIVRALRLAARPPEPTAKFPEDLSTQLIDLTNQAMSADTTSDRWLTLIDAVAASPIRRQVQPQGFPEQPTAQLVEFAKEHAGRIPALAQMLGVTIPPPPKTRAPFTARPGRPKNSGKRISGGAPKVEDAVVAEPKVEDAVVAEPKVEDAVVAEPKVE